MLAPVKSGEAALASSGRTAGAPPRHLPLLQFALVNVVCAALCAAAWLQGWLDAAFVGYNLWLCLLIVAVFVWGLALCGLRLWQFGGELEDALRGVPRARSHAAHYLAQVLDAGDDSRALSAGLLRLRLAQALAGVRHVAGMLVLLGLVGTVIGFIVALSGIDPQKVPNVDNVAPMVARLIGGMSIALFTTLVGSVLHLWLMLTHRILASVALWLYQVTVELGERRLGARRPGAQRAGA